MSIPVAIPTPSAYVQNVTQASNMEFNIQTLWTQYPEIHYLADENVSATADWTQTTDASWSMQLCSGNKFVELDRTLMTLQCLTWILDGSDASYQAFTSAQGESVKLTPKNFSSLNSAANKLKASHPTLNEEQVEQAFVTALVLGDIGKAQRAREIFNKEGCTAVDHDDYHAQVMQVLKNKPELCPSFQALPQAAQDLLVKASTIGTHYGHITHLEGGPSMFSPLKNSEVANSQDRYTLAFDFLVHIADVAGAAGHVKQTSSLVLTDETFRAIDLNKSVCEELAFNGLSEVEAYNECAKTRAEWLGLDTSKPQSLVLGKFGAMLRLFDPTDGAAMQAGFNALSNDEKTFVLQQFDPEHQTHIQRTATYMPAVLANIIGNQNVEGTKQDKIKTAFNEGLPFLARVLQQHSQDIADNNFDPQTPLNFNYVAGEVKNTPMIKQVGFTISDDGTIKLSLSSVE